MTMAFAYCPIVKGKLNDIKAVAMLARDVVPSIRPLIEFPPFLPTDKTEQVLGRFTKRMADHLPSQACYVDFPLLKPGARTSDGAPALLSAYGQLNAIAVPFEPVYGFDRDDSLWPHVIRQADRSGGLLLRLDPDDVDVPEETIDKIVELKQLGLEHAMTDVMIDMRSVTSTQEALQNASSVSGFINELAASVAVRRVIVAGSSAPKTVAGIQKDSHGIVTRGELLMWAQLATANLRTIPIYGDYGIIHPDFSDLTMSTNINGKIRYTEGSVVHVFRGHSLRMGNKYEQYRVLASRVINSGVYQGSTFSFGDRYIADCATGLVGTGNPGTWVHVDQNHHLTYVAKQVERLGELARNGSSADVVFQSA
ncbi:MAG: hypothetical protein C3F08_00360 [Candidatus Methylomirabilota bacterium]|nr:MAG: hypothetical protein C3F08_00360 [candidate division NC10 bacterium]